MRRIAFLLLALFIALIITGCGSPEQSVKMFLKYRIKNDMDAAKLYCTDEIDQRMDRGEFTLEHLGMGNPYGAPITWEGKKGAIALIEQSRMDKEAVIVSGSGPNKVTYHLKYEGGMWKIYDIEPAVIAIASPVDTGEGAGEGEGVSEEFLEDVELEGTNG
jgi:hypothetical protein